MKKERTQQVRIRLDFIEDIKKLVNNQKNDCKFDSINHFVEVAVIKLLKKENGK